MARRPRLRWTAPAKADVVAAHAYIRARDRAAAARYAAALLEAVRRLPGFPRAGMRLTNIPLEGEIRSVVVASHRVIYRAGSDELWILRVWDCRQDTDDLWRFFEGPAAVEVTGPRPPRMGRRRR